MLTVLACITTEHDPLLVALSALICAVGCTTTAMLLGRVGVGEGWSFRWLGVAAIVFGCSVWSLHFVAMLAFLPTLGASYSIQVTGLSIVVACCGSLAALLAWQAGRNHPACIAMGGVMLGLTISAMHYLGVAAMRVPGQLVLDRRFVAGSVVVSVGLSTVALVRAGSLETRRRLAETACWLSLAVCGLHFTGMSAVTLVPGGPMAEDGGVLATSTLAFLVGGVSLAILVMTFAAAMVEQLLSVRVLQDLGRMRLMSNLAHEVLIIHREGVVLEVNDAGERLFREPVGEIIGSPVMSLFTAESARALVWRERCKPVGRPPQELEIKAADGSAVAVELSCHPIDYLGKPATVVALHDLTSRRRNEARIHHMARHDSLTNLPNRYTLLERLNLALDAAARQRGTLAVVYIDLDRFKPVNDLHGHAAGDELLVQVAQRIRAEVPPSETLARVGGDEFVMLLTSDTQPAHVSLLANRVIETLSKPFDLEGHRIEIGASIGIALYPDNGANPDTLMRAADAAMYRVKEEGRSGLRFYEASMNAQVQARLQLKQELAGAVERGELMLHYQPMVNGMTGEVETFEALIRWNHEVRGMVGPVDFIPLAEESGLINQIGQWVIEEACREAASWPQPWRVSLNVSPLQFRQSDLCGIVATALNTYGIDPGRVVVEVTEGILIDDAELAVATLNQLRALGVRVALDDFGTGYSSLSYLQLFKFDKFKIDKSFVRKLGQSEEALTLTRTIVNLGHNLGLHVTAEGVETEEQLAILQGLSCDQIQGYLVGKPREVRAFTELDQARTSLLFRRQRRSA